MQESRPDLARLNGDDYFHYLALRNARSRVPRTKYTSKDFWQAAYNLGVEESEHSGDLMKILRTGDIGSLAFLAYVNKALTQCAEPLIIGKFRGITMRLIPTIGALPAQELPEETTPLQFSATNCVAISYPDGHPSSTSDPNTAATVHPSEHDILRRFAALGWVTREDRGHIWRKTGHVLVIDMDDRAHRDRQPWFVLASQWPTDGEDAPDGTTTYRAPQRVRRDDAKQPGVLPQDKNRTPLGLVISLPEGENEKPVLPQLGPHFEFCIDRRGGYRDYDPSPWGPDLATIMEWHWDPEMGEDVCYNKEGLEYMRFNHETGRYAFPDFGKMRLRENRATPDRSKRNVLLILGRG